MCNGSPVCRDQKCEGKCAIGDEEEGEDNFVDCKFEARNVEDGDDERNICADRESNCDFWSERRFGQRN
jgi:hypothetical protein